MAKAKELTALEFHALKLLSAKRADELRDELETVDGQAVDFCLHVSGSVNVQTGCEYETTKKPDLTAVLARVWASISPTAQDRVAAELEADFRDGKLLPPSEAVTEQVTKLLARLSSKQKQARRGAVTGNLEYKRLPRR
jgi:hypothetical protein